MITKATNPVRSFTIINFQVQATIEHNCKVCSKRIETDVSTKGRCSLMSLDEVMWTYMFRSHMQHCICRECKTKEA